MYSSRKEYLVGIDVSHPSDARLVQQNGLDCPPAILQPGIEGLERNSKCVGSSVTLLLRLGQILEAAELADIDPDFQTLRNLNTLEDYEAAQREAGERGKTSP